MFVFRRVIGVALSPVDALRAWAWPDDPELRDRVSCLIGNRLGGFYFYGLF